MRKKQIAKSKKSDRLISYLSIATFGALDYDCGGLGSNLRAADNDAGNLDESVDMLGCEIAQRLRLLRAFEDDLDGGEVDSVSRALLCEDADECILGTQFEHGQQVIGFHLSSTRQQKHLKKKKKKQNTRTQRNVEWV